ncbi:hypothetical protein JCM15831A_02380 [Asaia astilbis]
MFDELVEFGRTIDFSSLSPDSFKRALVSALFAIMRALIWVSRCDSRASMSINGERCA